jgi:hypothetical protein
MPEVQIKLSALWVALMLTYLLGDVLRFWSGDATPGAFGGLKPDMVPVALFGVALLMLIPIVMVVARHFAGSASLPRLASSCSTSWACRPTPVCTTSSSSRSG